MAFVYNIGIATIGPLAGFAVPPFVKGGEGVSAFSIAEPSSLGPFNKLNHGIFFANGSGGADMKAKTALALSPIELKLRIENLRSRPDLPDWITKALDGMESNILVLCERMLMGPEIDALERAAQFSPDQISEVAGIFFKGNISKISKILNAVSEEELGTSRRYLGTSLEFVPFYFGASLLDDPGWQKRYLAAGILINNTFDKEFPTGRQYGLGVMQQLVKMAQADPSWLARARAANAVLYNGPNFGISKSSLVRQIQPHKMMADLFMSGHPAKIATAFNLSGEAFLALSPAQISNVVKVAFEVAVALTDDSSKRDYLGLLKWHWNSLNPRLQKTIASDRLTQHLIIDDIRKGGDQSHSLINKFAPFLSPERFRFLRDELMRVVIAEPVDSIDVRKFQTLLNLGLDGVSDDQRLALFKKAADVISWPENEYKNRNTATLIPYISDILRGVQNSLQEDAVAYVVQKTDKLYGAHDVYRFLYLLFYLSRDVSWFRTGRILKIFVEIAARPFHPPHRPVDTTGLFGSEGGTNNDMIIFPRVVISGLSNFTIPPNYYPVLIEAIFINMFVRNEWRNDPKSKLVAQLLNDVDSEGTLQQVVNFLRRYNDLPRELRQCFAEEVTTDTMRSLSGLPPAQREKLGDRLLINPNKAVQRLRQFLIKHFVQGLAIYEDGERRMVSASIQQNAAVWERNSLLANLSGLLAFSDSAGRASITELARQLTSADVVEATRRHGSVRFVNSEREQTLTSAGFPAKFIKRWINGDKDFVISLGTIESRTILEADPLALKRSRYDFTLRQLAGHLNFAGASHMSSAEIADGLKEIFGSKTLTVAGYVDWSKRMISILEKMKRLADISEIELEGMADFINNNAEAFKSGFGGVEFYHDLQELKRNINASALEGQAYLVISSDPAGFLNLGREPLVTCQDPTRNTGHTNSGQPVNRIGDGRFRYAAIYMGESMGVQNGLAIPLKGAKLVARTQLEVTLDSSGVPQLLAERLYSAGGFIYPKLIAAKLREFAEDSLGLRGDGDVFIQFDKLGAYPPPLPDDKPIYRDTFRRP